MCGIVGYIGEKPAVSILLDGLGRLEYRGYDSAGLAFLQNGEFDVVRAKGKLSFLKDKMTGRQYVATIGIGHTRWATHGKPDETNAHPHYSRDVILVHNGIIENFKTLKHNLTEKGHKVVSETDTEIVCHLIQEKINQGAEFIQALRQSLKELRGAYSLVIMNRLDPSRIYVARKGSPLVIGIGEGENFVASDVPALLPYTRKVVFLDDNELAVLTRNGVDYFDFDLNSISKQTREISWNAAQAEKGGFKHFMLKEIMEQPRVLADTLRGRLDLQGLTVDLGEADVLLEKLALDPLFQIQIVGCGTSWHAGLVGRYWIENLARVPVSVELSSEFRYRQPLVTDKTLVIAISQSGETADTLEAIRKSKSLGAEVLSVCNVIESSIPRESDATIYTHAGPEIGVASTKAFTTQIAVLYMIALKLALHRRLLHVAEVQNKISQFITLPNRLESLLKNTNVILEMTDIIKQHQHCYFIGRGIQFPIVLEGALKLKEISYVHAEGFAGGEMKHGPIALIEEGTPVVAVAMNDSLYEKSISNVLELKARGARILAFLSEGSDEHADQLDVVMSLPQMELDLLPFLTILPLQLLAYHVADKKGTDVDQPRNLAKSVTVE